MTTSLSTAAQLLLDLFHQDYAPEGSFFTIEDVSLLMYSEYERMLQNEYTQAKALDRMINGNGAIEMSEEAVIVETVDVKKEGEDHIAIPSTPSFNFGQFDILNSGVQRVVPKWEDGDACKTKDLIRISVKELWMLKIAAPTDATYYYSMLVSKGAECAKETRVVLVGPCFPKKVEVWYVPGLDAGGDAQIATRFVKRITDSVLQTMLIAKQQRVIDKSNDDNPNAVLQTEANPAAIQPNP